MKTVKLLLATAAGLALAGAVTTSALAAPAVRVPPPAAGPDGTSADLASTSAATAMPRSPHAITGTWVVTVTPNAPIRSAGHHDLPQVPLQFRR